MEGHRFRDFIPPQDKQKANFDRLFQIFEQLILMTSGDVAEALSALNALDQRYGLTDDDYGMGIFMRI